MAQNIKVAVRVRPFIKRELDLGCNCAIVMDGQSTTIRMQEPKTFTYDYSYWSHDNSQPFASQETVWTDIGEVILNNALDGFNGCLFAYGQTGSGKSYSVLGSDAEPGIIPRGVRRIFEEKSRLEEGGQIEVCVWASYLEIYQEHIHDLLCPTQENQELTVMQHPKFGVYVPGLLEDACKTAEKVQELLDFGTKRRAIASTQMNSASSRSHAVFSIRMERLDGKRPEPGEKDTRHALTAKINLIDLAGSERQSKTGAEGSTLREGCSINKSLSALGMIIKELSEAHTKLRDVANIKDIGKSVPFRASKLTFLLKDSLAGNSRTYMIAAISPASDNIEETLSTLRFASSVKAIQTVSKQNKDKKDEIIDQLREELEALRKGVGGYDVNAEELAERERMIEEVKKSYEHQIEEGMKLEKLRKQALDHGGFSQEDMSRMLGVEETTPYLLNMADDPTTAGKLLFYLPRSKVITIGSDEESDIRFAGVGMSATVCKLINEDDHKLVISKCDPDARIVHDGKALGEGENRELKHGQCLFLGRSLAFKVVLPAVAREEFAAHELLLHDLEDEWAAMDSSPAMEKVEGFVSQACNEMKPEEATSFLRRVKEAAAAVDEANEINTHMRPGEGFSFDLTITSGHIKQIVVHASQSTEKGYQLLFLCSAEQFFPRLSAMRDIYFEFEKRKEVHVEAILNPWQETHMEEISHIVKELRAKVEHLGGDIPNTPTVRLRARSRKWSRAGTNNNLHKLSEDLEETARPDGGESTAVPLDTDFSNERELDSTTDLVVNSDAIRNGSSDKTGQQGSAAPLHYIDLAGSLGSSPSKTSDSARPVRQEGSKTRFTLAAPASSVPVSTISTVPTAPVHITSSSRFVLSAQAAHINGRRKERRVVGSPGPSRHSRGRASVRCTSPNTLRSPSGSLHLPRDPSQGSAHSLRVPSTASIRSTGSPNASYVAPPTLAGGLPSTTSIRSTSSPNASYVAPPLAGALPTTASIRSLSPNASYVAPPLVATSQVRRVAQPTVRLTRSPKAEHRLTG